MSRKVFWLSLFAVIISFAGGFLLANALNRREIEGLTNELGRLKASPPIEEEKTPSGALSDDEIRQKIVEADQNPENTEIQKNLAVALYRYASMTQQAKWLPDIARLLRRVVEKNPRDYNSLVSLGDIYFDMAQNSSGSNSPEAKTETNKNFEQSRNYYKQVLAINPNDSQLQTALGATYLFTSPPENDKAVTEFQKSLQNAPKNERSLEFMVRALVNSGKSDEARKYFDNLKQVNPNNQALPDLEQKLSQAVKK